MKADEDRVLSLKEQIVKRYVDMASYIAKSNHPLCTEPSSYSMWRGASGTKGVKNMLLNWNANSLQLCGENSFLNQVSDICAKFDESKFILSK